jgi:geranylgeranyl pyrophosphate synthase
MGIKKTYTIDLKAALAEKAGVVNGALAELIDRQTGIHDQLNTAIRYTLDASGKRIRGAIVLWCCELVSGQISDTAKAAAAAIEMVHTYSLVHDDLPAMDDDDLRRGKPTCHKAFGEAAAILAGDGLLTLAFEILSSEAGNAEVAVALINTLAKTAGPSGMIAGQMADLQSENHAGDIETLQYIHTNKTAKMFAAAATMGAIAGGAGEEQIQRLGQYGLKIGLGFQVADDMLDVSGTSEELGKTAGKDAEQGKITYPSVVGMDRSKRIAEEFAGAAVDALDIFGAEADILRQLTVELLGRTR